jgi:hypothetical protein
MIEQKYPYAFVFDICDKHIIFDSCGIPNINIHSYNTILLDPLFWKNIQVEITVIFQRDCIMFRPFSEHYLLYDYAGASYVDNNSPIFGGINGGFSIRKPSVMIECLEKITWEEIEEYRKTRKYSTSEQFRSEATRVGIEGFSGETTEEFRRENINKPISNRNEDVFFTHACELLCKTVPDIYSRSFLSIETGFNRMVSVHHVWNKGYIYFEKAMLLLKSSPLFSRVPEINIPFV